MAALSNTFLTRGALPGAARFLVVGLLGTAIDLGLFALLSVQAGLPALLANSLSYSAGIANNYFLHRRWTFAHRPRKAAGLQFAQFAVVSLTALAANNLVVLLLAPPLSTLLQDPVLAALLSKACATGIGVAWNYLANHLWIFRAAPAA
jgi:putative flippase GtrA